MERHPGMEQDDAVREAAKAALVARLATQKAQGTPFQYDVKILGVQEYTHKAEDGTSESMGLVFGWAVVCAENGKDYWDTQDDHIPEASMLKAAADFMEHSRVLGDMHQKAEGGQVLFAFPMTAEIAKAYGFTVPTTGLMIGVKPANKETLEKYRSGEYTGFSIGGRRLNDEEVD